jgi:hypothetical protein
LRSEVERIDWEAERGERKSWFHQRKKERLKEEQQYYQSEKEQELGQRAYVRVPPAGHGIDT